MNLSLKSFKFSGFVESSKSIVNRALILNSIFPDIKLNYQSQAQDVLDLSRCLKQFNETIDQITDFNHSSDSESLIENTFDVGSGGTTFRFFALYVSKFQGVWVLNLSPQLAQRPVDDLIKILKQLGVRAFPSIEGHKPAFVIESEGWTTSKIEVDFSKSSQFFSGLALASSDQGMIIKCLNQNQSSGYEDITLNLLKQIGIPVVKNQDLVEIKKPNLDMMDGEVNVGADWSSVIYLLSFSFSGAEIEIKNVDLKSSEPDLQGLKILNEIGLQFSILNKDGKNFSVLKSLPSQIELQHKTLDLRKNPDLFPSMAILFSQMALMYQHEVLIQYPEQLIYKESNRLKQIIHTLTELGFIVKDQNQVLSISSSTKCEKLKVSQTFEFDSKSDHRLIMSFELLKSFGYQISYNHKQEVKKSFSNFFEIING